ncbi:MAG: bifunctional 3-deoxy-7-phosphoheptulonate synthase/chorismate mutase [Peptococcaceae bacterium]|nr:bifunctional 3-deoxy-7-phosphoheptulonate synthase/chorismate mutase [Peptococcaceae bacterium]
MTEHTEHTERNREALLVKTTSFPSLAELFGTAAPCLIAGPCAVESLDQAEAIAQALVRCGIKVMRGGAYKPRTSPYDFQGLGEDGLKILDFIRQKYGVLIVTEILDPRDLELGVRYADMIQIGSRNMQNTSLLKEAGQTMHPVMLKRGMMSTLKEFMFAAEYIAQTGNHKLILCERGIRTFETSTRNTLDISSAAIIKQETSLPVIVDLSHSLARKDILLPVAKAVLALGVDALMVEAHNDPASALSDAAQQLSLPELEEFAADLFC